MNRGHVISASTMPPDRNVACSTSPTSSSHHRVNLDYQPCDHPALCWAHARRQFFELADIAFNAKTRAEGAGDLASRWKRSDASTCCSTSSGTATVLTLRSACACGKAARRSSLN
jgi:hypothetical protein